MERLQERWVHPASGRTYNLTFSPPKVFDYHNVIALALGRFLFVSFYLLFYEFRRLTFTKVSGLDDVTGEPLERRSDDNPESILKRLKTFHEATEPLIEYH